MPRLARACADLFLMAAPILTAILITVGTIVFWPGMLVGLPILVIVGWLCQKQVRKTQSEHHW